MLLRKEPLDALFMVLDIDNQPILASDPAHPFSPVSHANSNWNTEDQEKNADFYQILCEQYIRKVPKLFTCQENDLISKVGNQSTDCARLRQELKPPVWRFRMMSPVELS